MKLAEGNSDGEALRRLGGRYLVDDALIRRADGEVAVVVPFRDGDNRRGSIRLSHGERSYWLHWPDKETWSYLEPASSFQMMPNGWARMVGPKNVRIEPMGILLGTLGNANLEMGAAVIVLYHHDHDLEEWSSIHAGDFFAWLKTSETVLGWLQNPVWRPNVVGLIDDSWVDGWTLDENKEKRMAAVGKVTPKFIEAVSTPRVGGFPKIKRVLS